MKRLIENLLCSAAALSTLVACTQPAVAPKPLAFQERENTVRDWTTVARDIANRLANGGLLQPRTVGVAMSSEAPKRYFVHLVAPDSVFLQHVRDELETEIISRNGTVSTTPSDAIVVNLDIKVVRWQYGYNQPGAISTILGLAPGAGIVLGANGPYTPVAGFGMAAGTGLALDVLNSLAPNTNVEAIWSASVLSSQDVVMQVQAPLYIRAGDAPLYVSDRHVGRMPSFATANPPLAVQVRYAP